MSTSPAIAHPVWGLRRRLRLVLGVSAVIATLLVAASITLISAVRSDQSRVVSRYFRAIQVSNQLFTGLVDSETAIRGYALTADKSTLDPFKQFSSAQTVNESKELQSLMHGDAQVLAAQAMASSAALRWYEQWALPTIAAVTAHGVGHTSASDVEKGKQLFDVVRREFATYTNLLLERRQVAGNSLIHRTNLLEVTVIAAAVALLLAGAGLWFGLRHWVIEPLRALGADSQIVAGGVLDHQVRPGGPAEIHQLGVDIDGMRERLVEQVVDLEQANRLAQDSRDALARQATDLERSNRDLEQFAYVASHDLQEPLRKVASFCQMLESRYKGQLDERADQYIAFAVDGAKRMQQLINDLLEFSRVGRSARSFQTVDLQRCLELALDNLEPRLVASGAVVTADQLPPVFGDEPLLVQLLQNLIGNAIKFHGEGVPHVHIGAVRSAGGWEFSCADDGIGIDAKYSERVFVIFQRLHPREAYEGTGIGLAMCKKIVEYHGGHIWLDPEVDLGTTFRWTLNAEREGLQQ